MLAVVTDEGYVIYNDLYDVENENYVYKEIARVKLGQPYIDSYNDTYIIDELHAAGLRLKDGWFEDSYFCYKVGDKTERLYLPSIQTEIPQFGNTPYIFDFDEIGYMMYENKVTPVIRIYQISDLYFYDRMRLIQSNAKLKYCEDCDKLFIAHKNQVRCEECRMSGAGEKKKYLNIKNNPVRNKRRKMIQKLSKWHSGNNNYQNVYKNDLIGLFKDDGSNLDYLDELHQQFKTLDKTITKSKNVVLIEQWDNEKFNIWKQENPAAWLNEWIEKVNKTDNLNVEN